MNRSGLALGLVLLASSQAQAAPRERRKAGFDAPAQEHAIRSGVDREDLARIDARARRAAAQPSNELEARHYFRERPDVLGQQARQREQALLASLLKDREAKVLARRREAIALLRHFVRSEPERSPEMADALLRLSELVWELARAEYLDAFEAWQRTPAARRSPSPPRPDYGEAIALYDRILAHHPDFERLDLVLYMKAFALIERGQTAEAHALFRRILDEFPQSRFRPDAHMAFAEHIFNTDYDFKRALAEYDRVLQYEESELYDLALFKSAWCLWQLGQKTEAAVRFRRVLDLDGARAQHGRRKRLKELQSEALEYLIQVFTEDERNRAADVRRFLQEIGGERHVQRVLVKLSATYFDQARFDRGVEAYGLLLQLDPASREAPSYQLAIARGYMALDAFPKALEAYKTLAETYAPDATWASQQGDPESVTEARAMIERALREQALSLHELGQRDDRDLYFEQAAALYRVYLDNFDGEPDSYRISFYLGELLFHRLKRFDEAGDAYLAAARKDPKGEFTKDALYNAIGAFERIREGELSLCAKQPQKPCEETANDRKFSQAIELYASYYPNDPELPELLFRQGKLYYDRRVYDPAVRLFGQLLDRYPQSPYAESAGELVLDSFNQAQDYENIELWARRLKQAPAFASPAAQARLDGLILGAVFKLGEQRAARGEHAEAAQAYIKAAEEFPKDPRAAKAYYNAGLEYQRASDLAAADRAYRTLIAKHPGSEEGALGAWNGAQMYESIAQFSDAARYYEAYVEHFPRGEKAADAGYNAVLLRLSARDYGRAVSNGKRFVKRFDRDDSRDEVYFLIGRAYEADHKPKQAEQTYRTYLKRAKDIDRRVEAHTRLGQVLLSTKQHRAADAAFEDAVKEARRHKRKLDAGRDYAAQARFLQGDEALRAFEAVTIEGNVRGLGARLRKKGELLARAASIYAEVVDFGVAEWITAALYKIGRSYELFAKALSDAPLPSGLSEREQQVYRDELAMFVVPIEERALEAYEGGYRKARELGIYNRWTVLMREGLTRMNDVEYPPIREVGGEVTEAIPLAQSPVIEGLRSRPGGQAGERPSPPAKRARRQRGGR